MAILRWQRRATEEKLPASGWKPVPLRNSGQRYGIWLQWTAAEFHRSSEHKGGFQLIQKGRSWHIPLWRSQAAGINCVHRWCSGCWSSLCMRIRTVSLPNTPTCTHFSPSFFPSPLLYPKIPLAIKMPSVSAKHGHEWWTINKGKRVDLENCQFRSEWEASLFMKVVGLSLRLGKKLGQHRWVLVKNRMANFLSAGACGDCNGKNPSKEEDGAVGTFKHFMSELYVHSWRRGLWRFAAFIL